MKIAILSDIHGNLPACQAVLNDLPDVDAMLCAGDVVGYYPDANEVCDLLRTLAVPTVRGNHDAYVIGELKPDPQRLAVYRTAWIAACLTPINRAWLGSLPIRTEFRWGRTVLRLQHASPWDEDTYLYPDTPRLADVVSGQREIVVFGHTHHPLHVETASGGVVLNPGSVGQPRDRDPRASYAVVDTATRQVELRRVAYDVAGLQARLADLLWERATIDLLSRTT